MKMELNKFEQEAREKLANRTIKPSPLAWDRLDAMLTVAEQKPAKKHNRAWLYMAASFLLMLGVGGYFLLQGEAENHDGTTQGVNALVGKDTVPTGNKRNTEPIQLQDERNNKAVAGNQVGGASSGTAGQAVYVHATPFYTLPQDNIIKEKQLEEYQNLEPVNAPVQKISVDANALLASVQAQKTQVAKQPAQAGVKVDANALLNGIEGDMDMRFRDRVLDKLVKGYGEVKESVASRNYN